MRLLVISQSANRIAGAEMSLLRTMDLLIREHGYEIEICLPGEAEFSHRCAALGVRVHITRHRAWTYLGSGRLGAALRNGLRNLAARRRFDALLRQGGYDAVYTNSVISLSGSYAAARAGVPHVFHAREFIGPEQEHALIYPVALFRRGLRQSRAVICNSHALAQHMIGCFGLQNTTVIYNPMIAAQAMAAFTARSAPAGPLRLMVAGTVSEAKGQIDAIHALHHLQGMGLEARLSIIGPYEADYKAKLDRIIADLGLEQVVNFTGFSAEMSQHYQDHDLLLMCSRKEAFGRVTIEGMAASLPVVGAASGGTAEILGADERGTTYDPGNTQSLAEAIVQAAQNWSQSINRARAAHAWVAQHCLDTTYASRVDQVLQAACAPSPQDESLP